jgi:hypothetical protein
MTGSSGNMMHAANSYSNAYVMSIAHMILALELAFLLKRINIKRTWCESECDGAYVVLFPLCRWDSKLVVYKLMRVRRVYGDATLQAVLFKGWWE